ncbi:MAG: hypothetical protein IJS26_02810 [Alphaproteobacteria bacterium]|nr:hypothetical protein [Alphaproteobacteria bacterium]
MSRKNVISKFCAIFFIVFSICFFSIGSVRAQTPAMALGFSSAIKQTQTGEVTDPYGNVRKSSSGNPVMKGCTPLPEKYEEIRACILCNLFEVILKTDQNMASQSFDKLAGGFRNVILMVLALYIAYQTLMSVSALTKQDLAKYLQGIAIQSFKVLLAALLLTNSAYIYNYVINPIMNAGLEFGLAIIKADVLSDLQKYSAEYTFESGVISNALLANVMGTVKLFSNTAAELPAIGGSLICISTHEAVKFLIDLSMFIEGLICLAFGWAIAIACCFYLLDSVIRFGIFCTLLPFLIACWPFKVAAKYTKTGWDMFMNVFFNFAMMGLVITLSSELISQALTGGGGGREALEEAMNGNDIETLKNMMDLDGAKFLVLIACCIFAFKIVGQINELASSISSTDGGSAMGSKIGGLAAQTAKKVGGTGLKIAGAATGVTGVVKGLKDRANKRTDAIRSRVGGGSKSNPGGNQGGGNQNQNQNQNQPPPPPEPTEDYGADTSAED